MRRGLAALTMVLFCMALSACQSGGSHAAPRADRPLPVYEDVARRYNERTSRLSRLWARAVVSIDYKDEKGKSRYKQGDGHLQIIQPRRLALSVGKLGEVVLWLGSDDARYWLLEPREHHRGFVGRHDRVTRAKIDSLGLPVAPLDLIELLGITDLPEQMPPSGRFEWSADGRQLQVELPSPDGHWRYTLDANTMYPSAIALFQGADEHPVLSATLKRYEQVMLRGVGGFFPRIASRIDLTHHESGAMMRLTLEGMTDGGRRRRLTPEVFELSSLVEALGIHEMTDLDASAHVQNGLEPDR